MRLLLVAMLLSLTACGPANVVENDIQSEVGQPGIAGPTGADGQPGPTGEQGPTGADGQPGNDAAIQVVRYCGTISLCIDGTLYGIAGDSLVEITPGVHKYHGCSYQVVRGCEVTQL